MTPQQKGPYERKARDAKQSGAGGSGGERYTSQGIPYSVIEKEQKEREREESNMKKHISDIVKLSYLNNCKFIFC